MSLFTGSATLAALSAAMGSATMDEGLILATTDKTTTRVLLAGRVVARAPRVVLRINRTIRTARGRVVVLDQDAQVEVELYRLQVDATLRSELDTLFRMVARGRRNAVAAKRLDGSWRTVRLDRQALSWSEVADGLWETEVGIREVV